MGLGLGLGVGVAVGVGVGVRVGRVQWRANNESITDGDVRP